MLREGRTRAVCSVSSLACHPVARCAPLCDRAGRTMSNPQFSLPVTPVSKELIERVQFSVSSRNASAKVSECLTHVFVSPLCDDSKDISWQYVSSGLTCLLRKRELTKNGRRLIWTVHMCLYNVTYGVLVWKGALANNCGYTAVADNFHVFAMREMNAVVGLLIDEASQARELLRAYLEWSGDISKDQRGKGLEQSPPAMQFKKEMISKPCNFQHIQGTQALDECMEIERIKTDIQAAFFGLGLKKERTGTELGSASKKGSSQGKRKKEMTKPGLQFQDISVPHRGPHTLLQTTRSLDVDFNPMEERSHLQFRSRDSVPVDLSAPPPNSLPPQAIVSHSNPDLINGYPQGYSFGEEVAPHPPTLEPQNGYGYDQSACQPAYASPVVSIDAEVDHEVAGYTAACSREGLDFDPPGRLSPLSFEEFSGAAIFQPSFVSQTNI